MKVVVKFEKFVIKWIKVHKVLRIYREEIMGLFCVRIQCVLLALILVNLGQHTVYSQSEYAIFFLLLLSVIFFWGGGGFVLCEDSVCY